MSTSAFSFLIVIPAAVVITAAAAEDEEVEAEIEVFLTRNFFGRFAFSFAAAAVVVAAGVVIVEVRVVGDLRFLPEPEPGLPVDSPFVGFSVVVVALLAPFLGVLGVAGVEEDEALPGLLSGPPPLGSMPWAFIMRSYRFALGYAGAC